MFSFRFASSVAVLFSAAILATPALCQDKPLSSAAKAMVGIWKIDRMTKDGVAVALRDEHKMMYLSLKADGTAQANESTEKIQGQWKLTQGETVVEITSEAGRLIGAMNEDSFVWEEGRRRTWMKKQANLIGQWQPAFRLDDSGNKTAVTDGKNYSLLFSSDGSGLFGSSKVRWKHDFAKNTVSLSSTKSSNDRTLVFREVVIDAKQFSLEMEGKTIIYNRVASR